MNFRWIQAASTMTEGPSRRIFQVEQLWCIISDFMFEYTSGLRAAVDNGEGDETAGPKRDTPPRLLAIGTRRTASQM